MDPIITGAITKATTDVVKEVAKESKEPRKTFDDLWYLTFGRLGLTADKLRFKHQIDLESYKNSLIQEIETIPEENLQEPKLSIIGPALEASRFYIEEEELRKMFAKIVAASFDKTKSPNTHHSFVEIIKQITPIEAKILKLFINETALPIVRYKITKTGTESVIDLGYPVFKGFLDDIISGKEYAIELSNLKRLNLIEENDYYLKDEEKYDFYKNSTFHKETVEYFSKVQKECNLAKGILELTPLGKGFIKVCL
ncbi:DUF4393 domain-containing protein [Lysinibacillus sp.]|uniref:DUF4393 domain-containing protein n=1 Tax=Lysinibacillus sp. TaxID=1869345 RepID=UPI00289EED6C|nr:DUF4393 domain-containing protein [Lysinibacillus sp.]